jgi:hypothetical protein
MRFFEKMWCNLLDFFGIKNGNLNCNLLKWEFERPIKGGRHTRKRRLKLKK